MYDRGDSWKEYLNALLRYNGFSNLPKASAEENGDLDRGGDEVAGSQAQTLPKGSSANGDASPRKWSKKEILENFILPWGHDVRKAYLSTEPGDLFILVGRRDKDATDFKPASVETLITDQDAVEAWIKSMPSAT